MTKIDGVIGIIGGNGWLGRALARPALETGIVSPDRLIISCRAGTTDVYDQWPDVRITGDNQALVEASDIVILSVRPDQFDAVSIAARGKLVISLMAGRSSAFVASRTGSDRVIRAMPNAAAEIGLSFSPWCASAAVTEADRRTIRAFLAASGTEDEVQGDAEIDYFTGFTGSGPAFPALFARAMINHAISQGIAPDTARRAAMAVFDGAAEMMKDQDLDRLIAAFLDYRGTTAAGLTAMQDHGIDQAIAAGLDAARAKAAAMAREAE